MAEDNNGSNGNGRLHWTLDYKIPIAVVLALCAQTGGAMWWASKIDVRVDRLEQTRTEDRAEMKQLAADRIDDRIKDGLAIGKLETLVDELRGLVNRIDDRVNPRNGRQ